MNAILDPLRLTLGKEYNLNTVKEIKVTDEFLSLDKDHRGGCQNDEIKSDCKTKSYRDALLKQCGCLPFNIRVSDLVINHPLNNL